SASLIPPLEAYAATLPPGALRGQVDQLIAAIGTLTTVDERALAGQVHGLDDAALRDELRARLPAAAADPIDAMVALGQLMALARARAPARAVSPAAARRLTDFDITAAADLQRRGSALLDGGRPLTARQGLRVLGALTDAAYGVGLLSERERAAAAAKLQALL